MASWLSQTKRAKEAMETCGFKWPRDFYVRTKFDQKLRGYEDAQVFPRIDDEQMIAKAKCLAATGELDITVFKATERHKAIIVIVGGNGKLSYR